MVRSPTSGRSRSLGLGDSDPETNASRLEHSIASKEEHDQESGLGLAWRPTGPGERPNQYPPAGVDPLNPLDCSINRQSLASPEWINLSLNEAEQAPRLPNPNCHADGEAERAPRLPNPNCHYGSEAKRAPRSPNPNRHLRGEAERAPRLPNPNCHDDSEAHRAPRLHNPNCHYGSEALILPCEATT